MNHWIYFAIGIAIGFGIGVVVMSLLTVPVMMDESIE
jgi:hypothetical protein